MLELSIIPANKAGLALPRWAEDVGRATASAVVIPRQPATCCGQLTWRTASNSAEGRG